MGLGGGGGEGGGRGAGWCVGGGDWGQRKHTGQEGLKQARGGGKRKEGWRGRAVEVCRAEGRGKKFGLHQGALVQSRSSLPSVVSFVFSDRLYDQVPGSEGE